MPERPHEDPDVAAFPLRPSGRGYAEHTVGRTFAHTRARTLNEADHTLFSAAMLAWNRASIDRRVAEGGAPMLNPYLVLCTAIGLSVEDLSERSEAFLGLSAVEFRRPVPVGATITARSVVLQRRPSASRPGHGIVTWRTEAFDGTGEPFLAFERTNLFAIADADAD